MSFVKGVNVAARTGWTVLEIGPGVASIAQPGRNEGGGAGTPPREDPTCTLDGF
jgi:hypothetical protein